MLQGIQAHAKLNTMSLVTADSLMSIEDALHLAKLSGREIIKRNVTVTGKILTGTIDEIHLAPKEITIIDDKNGLKAYQSYINQVLAYRLALEEQFDPHLTIHAAIRSTNTGNVIWEKPFLLEEDGQRITDLAIRIQGIIDETIKPKVHRSPNKCRSCRFAGYCRL